MPSLTREQCLVCRPTFAEEGNLGLTGELRVLFWNAEFEVSWNVLEEIDIE